MTDCHVITPEAADLVMQVIDGELIIVLPPLPAQQLPCGALATDAAHKAE